MKIGALTKPLKMQWPFFFFFMYNNVILLPWEYYLDRKPHCSSFGCCCPLTSLLPHVHTLIQHADSHIHIYLLQNILLHSPPAANIKAVTGLCDFDSP